MDSPRQDLLSRKTFVATYDPWAARVKADAVREQEELNQRRSLTLSRREQHRRDLEDQINQKQAFKDTTLHSKMAEAQEALDTARRFNATQQEQKDSARARHKDDQKQRLEQLRLLDERRRREQLEAEREARELNEKAMRDMEDEKARIRARRRAQEDAIKDAVTLNNSARRQKFDARRDEQERDVQQMQEYAKILEEQDARRREQMERHRPKLPLPLFASADRFEAPKYKAYFEVVEQAAEQKKRDDEARELQRKADAKELEQRSKRAIAEQARKRHEQQRLQLVDAARERVALDDDTERYHDTTASQRDQRKRRNLEYREDLKRQMQQARERELIEITRGTPLSARN
jgi:hypothetical protein